MTDTTYHIDPNQREDLRNVYLKIWASAIVAEIPEVAASLKLKPRYVTELVAILANHTDREGNAFVVLNTAAGEMSNDGPHDWWQTSYVIDDKTEDEMMQHFDAHFPVSAPLSAKEAPSTPRTPRNATNPADLPACKCGCGEICNRGRNYRPGHDARHAGIVARHIAEKDNEDVWDAALSLLPTDALKAKATDMANRLLKKAAAKEKSATPTKVAKEMVKEIGKLVPIAVPLAAAKAEFIKGKAESIERVEEVDGVVKVGRWVHEAKQNPVSKAVRYTKKNNPDVWHVATDAQAASFVPKEA